ARVLPDAWRPGGPSAPARLGRPRRGGKPSLRRLECSAALRRLRTPLAASLVVTGARSAPTAPRLRGPNDLEERDADGRGVRGGEALAGHAKRRRGRVSEVHRGARVDRLDEQAVGVDGRALDVNAPLEANVERAPTPTDRTAHDCSRFGNDRSKRQLREILGHHGQSPPCGDHQTFARSYAGPPGLKEIFK